MFSAILSVLIILLIAVVITSVKTIVDFVGAFAAAYISYVIPPAWMLIILRKESNFSWTNTEVLLNLALFSLGCFFFCFGTYSAVSGA